MRRPRDDDGAVLVLALIFVLVVGLIGGAIASFASASLAQTSSLGNGRAQAYAAEGAIQVAVQQVRDLKAQGATPGYAGVTCPTISVTIPENVTGAGSVTEALKVVCVIGQAGLPFERKIVFAACTSGTADASCLSGQSTYTPAPQPAAIVVATAVYYDLPSGCSTVAAGCPLSPGTSVDVSGWDASHTTG